MDKHTKGPWKILPEDHDKPYIRIRGTQLGMRWKIANVLIPNDTWPEYDVIETRANATLIAAAPELLAACRKALYTIKGREHTGFLEDVIAKATGGRD